MHTNSLKDDKAISTWAKIKSWLQLLHPSKYIYRHTHHAWQNARLSKTQAKTFGQQIQKAENGGAK
jgi:hypothetical protein